MRNMARQSNFLPESVSNALKSITKRAAGGVLLALALWALYALVFFNPYLDGFAAASTFGEQSVMGQIVGFLRYGIGFVPSMFLILCIARWGLAWLAGWESDATPEFNFIKCFIAVCAGAAGFGLIAPADTFGGLAGCIVAADVSGLIGAWGALVGIAALGIFIVMGARLLHIKWSQDRKSVV